MDKQPRVAGLIYGPFAHYLDHLAPLCATLEIPLIVTDANLSAWARRYYPMLQVLLWEALTAPEKIVSHFEILFYCTPRDLFDEIFFFAQRLLQKKVHTIWCPHGNSDKGSASFYMEALHKEEAALVYGKQLLEFLQKKNIWEHLKGHVITGNYRYAFFQKHQQFYTEIAHQEILRKLPQGCRTLLYAPTWQDWEKSCSFFDAIEPLIDTLPKEHNLIVKLHPNLEVQEEFKVSEIIDRYQSHPHVLFLTHFPPVYALLYHVDAYIGDTSSIGYDFLTFDRPLFFLQQQEQEEERYLFRCGTKILKKDYARIHEIISHFFLYEVRDFSSLRKDVYKYAFGHPKKPEELKKELSHLYTLFADPDLNFF